MNRTKIVSTAKYAGTSITLGTAITSIILFAFPHLKEISESVGALVIFAVNMILAMTGVISDSDR